VISLKVVDTGNFLTGRPSRIGSRTIFQMHLAFQAVLLLVEMVHLEPASLFHCLQMVCQILLRCLETL